MTTNDFTVKPDSLSLPNSGNIQQGSNVPAEVVSGLATTQRVNSMSQPNMLSKQLEATEEQLAAIEERVVELNSYMQNLNRSLQFSVDEQSGDTVIKVIDSETDELIRQIPAEELLVLRSSLEEYRGMLLEMRV
ncbi:flagellar protein FlaG [Methylophaga pinxianii]|uniref:flagellar protein FlaG n=1 Tax=Methylophaga pinxianii TaxID=2881052 RepID=UPI001CF27302|nr:flagellar protein FlaG [Methylophaga pinxianii]MCB2427794.1 flagellar protein FlaG [Methylophaga pinxianii]UPH45601.1 flagellar protein FlaG [Methylophaga pinxianii]